MDNTRRVVAYIAVSIASLAGFSACGDDTGADSDAAIIDGADGSGADANDDSGIDLPGCVDNIDCRGGEVCRDGYCREACGADDACEGELAVCDVSRGFCVACIDDAQCSSGFCDVRYGVCVDAECSDDAECRGGESCRGGRCVSIDEQICEPGETRCQGDTLLSCSRDGTREDQTVCSEPFRCGANNGVAACIRDICTPDEVGCLDPTTAYVCDSTGTSRTELPCDEGDVCDAGVCLPGICEGGSSRCEGDALVVCDELGTRESVIDCNSTPTCADSDTGCTCADAACTPRVCLPGSQECAGSGSRTCADNGLAWSAVTPCDDGESCIAGLCVSDTCDVGTSLCASNTLIECNASGTGYVRTDCALEGEVCIDDGGSASCASRLCEPGTSSCSATADVRLVCNALGTAQQEFECGADRVCIAGACVDQVCDPGARRCAAGNAEECNGLGTGYVRVDTCTSTEVCVDGYCEPDATGCRTGADCPAPPAFCDGATFVEFIASGACNGGTCNYDGVERRTDCAATGQSCTGSGCFGDVECVRDADCGSLWTSGYCVDSVCVDCRDDLDCDTVDFCSGGSCLPLDEADCDNDAECVALAESLGSPEPDARCLAGSGCYVPGNCNRPGDTTPSDPFNARCPEDLSCDALIPGLFEEGVCAGCATNADCRPGETCTPPLFFGSNYCASDASPLPFP